PALAGLLESIRAIGERLVPAASTGAATARIEDDHDGNGDRRQDHSRHEPARAAPGSESCPRLFFTVCGQETTPSGFAPFNPYSRTGGRKTSVPELAPRPGDPQPSSARGRLEELVGDPVDSPDDDNRADVRPEAVNGEVGRDPD